MPSKISDEPTQVTPILIGGSPSSMPPKIYRNESAVKAPLLIHPILIKSKSSSPSISLPDPLKEYREKNPKASYFMFRGLKVQKENSKFTVLEGDFKYVQDVSAEIFLDQFGAASPWDIGKVMQKKGN